MTEQQPQITRFFTSARRIPILIGKINGTRIWGGPYTMTQLGIGGALLWIGYQTADIWGHGLYPFIRLIVLGGSAWGATWAAGRIPATRRRLPDLAADLATAVSLPELGSYKGAPVRTPKPHYVGGTVLMLLAPLEHAARAAADPQTAPAVDAATEEPRRRPTAQPAGCEPNPDPAPAPVPAAAPSIDELPPNVTPIRRTHATGLERLLEQARRKDPTA